MKRTQIYVEEEQDRRLAQRAAQLGVTKSELIRTAVDGLLADDDAERRLDAFRDAVERTAGAVESFPDATGYPTGLRRSDADRLDALHDS